MFLIVLLLLYLRSYESTDDAQVDGHLNAISSRISGTVIHVYVENNQAVTAGQLLAELDPRDYQVALQQARAAYVQAGAQVRAENPNLPIVQTTNQTTISTSNADVVAAQAAVSAAQDVQNVAQRRALTASQSASDELTIQIPDRQAVSFDV